MRAVKEMKKYNENDKLSQFNSIQLKSMQCVDAIASEAECAMPNGTIALRYYLKIASYKSLCV